MARASCKHLDATSGECGHVGCCDESTNEHATKHFHATGHPVIQSAESSRWCHVDELLAR